MPALLATPPVTATPRGRTAPRPRLAWSGPVAALGLASALLTVTAINPLAARPAPQSFADLAEQVAPAVVNIAVERHRPDRVSDHDAPGHDAPGLDEGGEEHQFGRRDATPGLPFPPGHPFGDLFKRHFGGPGPGHQGRPGGRDHGTALGSGFVIDAAGYIVTNAHVIEGADKITVTFHDGDSLEADLVGSDRRTDLALLKVATDERLPAIAFGESEIVRPGDWVMAVGNPFGLGGTVTAGIVSARGRDLRGAGLVDFLQIDAPINRGNSGGPTFNVEGEVIGINTAIFSPSGGSVGIGFAIPSDTAKVVIEDLKDDGKVARGWLGVQIQPVTEDLARSFGLDEERGALIAAVEPDSPAAAAGLEAGHNLLAGNGQRRERFKDLPRQVAATPADTAVEVELWRGGKALSTTVTTGLLAQDRQASSGAPVAEPKDKVAEVGLQLAALDADQRARFGIAAETRGVLVLGIKPGSPAAEVGLRPGDVIRRIAEQSVEAPAAVVKVIAESRAAGRELLPLLIVRDAHQSYVSLRIAKA